MLAVPAGYTLGSADTRTLAITDNDTPGLELSPATVTVGEEGGRAIR